jgi:hypothetical protein
MRYALILGALVVCGCGSKDECSPGASAACVGSAGCVGTQVCNAEGTAFGDCDCGPAWAAPCNVAKQEGCPSDKRCGFIVINNTQATPGCVPIGGAGALERCSNGTPGTTTGFDDCQAGLVCISGECRAACRPGEDTCGSSFACLPYASFGDSFGNLGACEPTCNPITQVRDLDQAPACGSPNPASPNRGCYGVPGSSFVCTPAGNALKTHRQPATDENGDLFLNSCAPGYAPLLPMGLVTGGTVDATPACIAFCSPAVVHSGATAQAQGVSPHTCPARGANAPTEECRFFWLLEQARSAYSNTVGFCLDPGRYTYDDDRNDSTPGVPLPSCTTLASSDTNANGQPDHLEWGCGPLPL